MSRGRIQRISMERLREMLHQRMPRGRFLAKEGRKWVAVDNSTRDAWTEGFPRKRQAVRWLRGEFEVGDKAKQWTRITEARELVSAAARQDIDLSDSEADMLLGYLEGHEYCLMVDDDGATLRHDEQYGDVHRGDEPYPILAAIEFCQEMNEDLIRDDRSWRKPDAECLAELLEDEQVLGALMERVISQLI